MWLFIKILCPLVDCAVKSHSLITVDSSYIEAIMCVRCLLYWLRAGETAALVVAVIPAAAGNTGSWLLQRRGWQAANQEKRTPGKVSFTEWMKPVIWNVHSWQAEEQMWRFYGSHLSNPHLTTEWLCRFTLLLHPLCLWHLLPSLCIQCDTKVLLNLPPVTISQTIYDRSVNEIIAVVTVCS